MITGVGPVVSIGVGREAFFEALKGGACGISPVTAFDCGAFRSRTAGEIRGFKADGYLKTPKTYLDRSSEFAFAAVSLALRDSGLDLEKEDRTRVGLLLGTAYGSLGTMSLFFDDFVKKGPRFVKPVLFPHVYPNTAISLLAIEYGIQGFHTAFASGSISAGCALVYALDLIRSGRADVVLAGGVEALSESLYRGCAMMDLLSPQGEGPECCRPFDRRANGMVLGEGGGILVLEERDRARARGARILGEFMGGGMAGGAEAIARAMRAALAEAGAENRGPDLVCASANSVPGGDAAEARAIGAVLKTCSPDAAVGGLKSAVGETIGASGALQAIAAVAAMETGVIPPIIGLEEPVQGVGLNFVRGAPLRRDVNLALVNSVDPGGSAVSLVVGKCRE